MLTRILTAAVALALFIPVLWFSGTVVFPITVALLCVIAVYELYKCFGSKMKVMFGLSAMIAAALPIIARYKSELIFGVCAVYFCMALGCQVFYYGKMPHDKMGFALLQTIIVILGFTCLVYVRDREEMRYLLIFVAAWGTDTFAYFTGRAFGKTKLCPEISPKKTIVGAIGGIIGCALCFAAFAFVCNTWFGTGYSYLTLVGLSIPLSISGQIGDLAASTVKRFFGVKDYGNLFPGHGGVLDRFDSILPITLFAFAVTEFIK